MNLELHRPEVMQRVNAHIQTGQFHDADELIEKALDALDAREGGAATDARFALLPDQTPANLTVFEQGLGMFGSPDDAALLDEVVALAYADRRRPSKDQPFAL